MDQPFEIALEAFRQTAEDLVRAHYASEGYTFEVPHVKVAEGGRKYVKLLNTKTDSATGASRNSTSVHSFVERSTGDIFKPASFRTPAKHARGNIYIESGMDALSVLGDIIYLR